MKKLLLLSCLVMLSCFFAHAQDKDNNTTSATNGFKFAIKGGVNSSKASGDIGNNESALIDFHIGSVIKIPTSLNFGIQAEPQFSRVGASKNSETLRRYTFLDIPVMAQIEATNNLSFEAGPKIALTLSQKQRVQGSLKTVDRLKTITLGLAGGATYNINNNLFGQFRMGYWFSDIIRKDGGDSEGTSLLLFQLAIGYWFN